MEDRAKTVRNVAILLLLAAVVAYVPGGGRAAATVQTILGVAFMFGLGLAGLYFYRQHRTTIYGLGDRRRAVLYSAVGVAAVTLAAKPRMWQTSFGEFVWFVLLGCVAYTLFALYRYSRSY
ncbi:MAG TPA: hypothetical protein VNV42_10685 [Solirubrobacteraceae bacterium]|jgi:hypothetical protein|nr:hypothetical protein [Solirubrobacteraceae bacterium]